MVEEPQEHPELLGKIASGILPSGYTFYQLSDPALNERTHRAFHGLAEATGFDYICYICKEEE